MPSIPGLHRIPAGNPGPLTGGGNWTYLVTGRVATIIDAGVGLAAHVEAIAAVLDGVGQRLRQVVVTHDHRLEQYADRVVRVEDGRVVADEPGPAARAARPDGEIRP